MSKSKLKIFFILVLITIIGLLFFKETTFFSKLKYPKHYKIEVMQHSSEYNIDENLIYSVIKAESNFYPYAKSKKSAMGLMQLLETTWNWGCSELNIASSNYYDVNQNIEIGTWYLKRLINEFGSEELAIVAYNAGSGNVRAWINAGLLSGNNYSTWKIPFNETRNYLDKVMKYKSEYIEIYGMNIDT